MPKWENDAEFTVTFFHIKNGEQYATSITNQ